MSLCLTLSSQTNFSQYTSSKQQEHATCSQKKRNGELKTPLRSEWKRGEPSGNIRTSALYKLIKDK